MTDKPKKTRASIRFLWFIVRVGVLVLNYALSLGPANWIFRRAGASGVFLAAFEKFYTALALLAEISPAFGRLMLWYVALWY